MPVMAWALTVATRCAPWALVMSMPAVIRVSTVARSAGPSCGHYRGEFLRYLLRCPRPYPAAADGCIDQARQ